VITTAASAGWGRFRNRPGTRTIMRMISAAPVTPVSCVLSAENKSSADSHECHVAARRL
jgi:hypothetical protein